MTSASHRAALASTQYDSKWFKKNLSRYAATNDRESLAEAFCAYTDPAYKKGTLPPLIETIIDAMLHP